MAHATVYFECKNCGNEIVEVLEIAGPNLMAESAADSDVFEDHAIDCTNCGHEHEIQTVNGIGGTMASLYPQHTNINISQPISEDDFDFDFDDFEPAKDPLQEYQRSSIGLNGMIIDNSDPESLQNRMILSQYIATMEAYLTDTLLDVSDRYEEIKKSLVDKSNIFKGATIPLSSALFEYDAAERQFRGALQAVLYHNLERVSALYQVALHANIFDDAAAETKLKEAILIRHDCVHRNGQTKEGELREITSSYLREVAGAIESLVGSVEAARGKRIEAIRVERQNSAI